MVIEFVCEHCGRSLLVEDYLAGQSIECPYCNRPVVVPDAEQRAVIDFQCLGCGTAFRVPAFRAGARSKCPTCGAALQVPQPDAESPSSALAAQTPDPASDVPVPPLLRGRGEFSRPHRSAAALPAEQPVGFDRTMAPSTRGVSPGSVILIVAVSLAVAVAAGLWLLAGRGSPGGSDGQTDYADLNIDAKYERSLDVFTVVNREREVCQELTFTIETTGGDYTHKVGALRPDEPLQIPGNQFVGANGARFDAHQTQGRRFVVTARLPSGRMGRCVMNWSGPGVGIPQQ